MKRRGRCFDPKFKCWISSDKARSVFGDGKYRLLEAIEQKGSLTEACKSLVISYRKAWGDLRKLEGSVGVAFLERHRGGREGGHTTLTNEGKIWVKAYSRFRSKIESAVTGAYEKHIQELLEARKDK